MREKEVYMLYEMNKESNIVIETPVRMTERNKVPYLVQNCAV